MDKKVVQKIRAKYTGRVPCVVHLYKSDEKVLKLIAPRDMQFNQFMCVVYAQYKKRNAGINAETSLFPMCQGRFVAGTTMLSEVDNNSDEPVIVTLHRENTFGW
tara:strand:+ start:196 stop:507 length:312 start_codon:yes stop_codon:yes gene_type:complete